MTDISDEQTRLRASISRNAIIWGTIAALVAGGLVFWLAGALEPLLRAAAGLAAAGAAGFFSYRGLFNSGAAQARCASCNAPFSVKDSGRSEVLIKSEPRSKVEMVEAEAAPVATPAVKRKVKGVQPAPVAQLPSEKTLTTWIEDTFEVTITATCAKCGAETTRLSTQVRERDKQTVTKGVPDAPA